MFEPISSRECKNFPKFLGVVVLLDETKYLEMCVLCWGEIFCETFDCCIQIVISSRICKCFEDVLDFRACLVEK